MKLEFANENVVLSPLAGDPRSFRVIEPVVFDIMDIEIVVPKGFVTDLASVPRILWAYLPPFGNYTAAAIVHDFLYTMQHVHGGPIKRSFADRVFLHGMAHLGVRETQRLVMYRAVRAFGWIPWHRHRNRVKPNSVRVGK
jgi:Protein of unknown function (DUF1353)